MEYDPRRPVYPVHGRLLSLLDLLATFRDESEFAHGISRYSDLHLKTGETVRFRYDGDLTAVPGGAILTPAMAEALILPLLGAEERRVLAANPACDVDAGFDWPEARTNFRVNVFRDRSGLAAVVRVLPAHVPKLETIGFPDERVPREITQMHQGLVLVTGITGSGKSTTIASLIQHINRTRPVRIITLEDPVEYVLESDQGLISQREVGRHIESFSGGLRSALREDPDIIFVGEIRDRETASLALTAAETGHLVFSTMHTRDAKGALTRIVDLFPPDRVKELCTQMSFALTFLLGQRLVARADGQGRRVAFEILRNTLSVANLIRTGNWQQIYSVLETQQRDGMITLERHLVELCRTGQISAEEAIKSANDSAQVAKLLV